MRDEGVRAFLRIQSKKQECDQKTANIRSTSLLFSAALFYTLAQNAEFKNFVAKAISNTDLRGERVIEEIRRARWSGTGGPKDLNFKSKGANLLKGAAIVSLLAAIAAEAYASEGDIFTSRFFVNVTHSCKRAVSS